ncbi:MAG: cobalt ECF transporter T component CbiQ [Deltaproteobacteria bacterium]|nr:MAG: cobalt ECF transporter T component CbiQ [Deltaproteobacteria bacterium]
MLAIDGNLLDFKRLDLLALKESPVHRLDPRAKVLTTLVFILCVVSFDRYELAALLPFALYPVVLLALGDLPAGYIARKVAVVLPFAVMVGLFNPLFDRQVLLQLGPLDIWGGWLSCLSIVVRALLTAAAAIVLVAITGFPAICEALERLGMPRVFAVQLLFLYRYIFVLADEGGRVARARQLRACGTKGLGLRHFGPLVGHLLLRTWERAERVHMAMLARGFAGEVHTRRQGRFGAAEGAFLLGWGSLFVALRLYNLPHLLGQLLTGN